MTETNSTTRVDQRIMTRETLCKRILNEAVERQARLLQQADNQSQSAKQRYKVYSQLVVLNAFISHLTSTDCGNPFTEFHIRRADGTTVYIIGDDIVDIIDKDIPGFVDRVLFEMINSLPQLVAPVFSCESIDGELITLCDRILHDKRMP